MSAVSVRLASEADRPVLERLWLMFRHDMSEFTGALPNPDGTFRSERLEAALTSDDWASYLITSADRPAGLAFVRALTTSTRALNSFFVVRGARRRDRAARRPAGRRLPSRLLGGGLPGRQRGGGELLAPGRHRHRRRRVDRDPQTGSGSARRASRCLDHLRRSRLAAARPALIDSSPRITAVWGHRGRGQTAPARSRQRRRHPLPRLAGAPHCMRRRRALGGRGLEPRRSRAKRRRWNWRP